MIRKIPKIKPVLVLTFDEPTQGFWDGGAKKGGTFIPELTSGRLMKWGSWELNYWFTCGFGRSLKHTATIAKKNLEKSCDRPCKVEIIWE
jgi:hypothetical protein